MSKPTTIKRSYKKMGGKTSRRGHSRGRGCRVSISISAHRKDGQLLSALVKCEKLSLSTNMIEKIAGLSALKNLKILSLSRNYIKNIAGLEGVADSLEELWMSYNFIEKLKGIGVLKNLKVLYIANNVVKEWVEFNKLNELQNLQELLFVGNPLMENMETEAYKAEIARRLPHLKKLDGEPILRDEGD
ncbi:hypothetical protein NQ317_003527 [Molorchus minor]|uniref:Dynein axonemal light chain 1 n=1 Tax=Molorchus minor TaxID=1323400 RepID=A0ABQ9K214_9CUCU|nr:hypothetical protein NQ317_003527 [Molorchus minor]